MTDILENVTYRCGVSTTLNKDVNQYGKHFMFDDNKETCWASDQGSPQWILLQWENPLDISSISIQFQGGFVGKNCEFVAWHDDSSKTAFPFYPEDNNSIQTFPIQTNETFKKIMIKFNDSTDFFGRIIIYKLSILSKTQ